MKGLLTLIKLNKRTLDELRRKMVSLETQKNKLLGSSDALQAELVKEMQLASATPEMGNFFGGFSRRIQQRQLEIAEEVIVLDKKMLVVDAEIRDAFAEVKKYEIALENAKLRAKEKHEHMENLELDEIAEQQFRRKKDEG